MEGVFLPADLLTFTKSDSRFTDCQPNLPADWFLLQLLLADLLSPNLLAEMGGKTASRFTDFHQICQQIYWPSAKSASRFVPSTASPGRFADCCQIWQFWANFSRKAGRQMNTEVLHERPTRQPTDADVPNIPPMPPSLLLNEQKFHHTI